MAAAYALTQTTAITRTSDGANIPAVQANTDYQAYLAWVAAGNTADPAPALPKPTTITPGAFFARFTAVEQAAIQGACAASPTLALGLTSALMLGYVDLTSPAVSTWLAGLVTAGALTSARAAAVVVP